jgi:hypothetical protein
MNDDRKRNALELMRRIGGGFAKAIAEAWFKADKQNDVRLTEAFGGMLEDYAVLSDKLREANDLQEDMAETVAIWEGNNGDKRK